MLASAGALCVPLTAHAHAQGDAAAGEKVFAHCAACHSNKPGENKFGPSLAGVFSRKSGTEPGYNLFVGNEGAERHVG
jgi:cytochrome c